MTYNIETALVQLKTAQRIFTFGGEISNTFHRIIYLCCTISDGKYLQHQRKNKKESIVNLELSLKSKQCRIVGHLEKKQQLAAYQ